MNKLIAFLAVALLALGGVALAERPANPGAGGECVQAGIATLKSLDALVPAAQQNVNYADFDENSGDAVDRPIRTDLGDEFFAPLGQVVKLHAQNPGLFAWCD